MACRAARICLAWLRLQPALLDPDSCRQRMFRSYSYVNRAPRRSFSAASVTSGEDADRSHDPVAAGTQAELIKVDALPPHCDLKDAVQLAQGADGGTSKRRHTIGLIPSSQTLTCTAPAVSGMGGMAAESTASLALAVAAPDHLTAPGPAPPRATPQILMLSFNQNSGFSLYVDSRWTMSFHSEGCSPKVGPCAGSYGPKSTTPR